ncbi:MAG TPA: hypothetical protein VKA21_04400 [Candidatus Binatia bacterium]|nr:hypothetical protein [Candidatus Binatia bacterium]
MLLPVCAVAAAARLPFEGSPWARDQRAFPAGDIPLGARRRAWEAQEEVLRAQRSRVLTSRERDEGGWVEIGPSGIRDAAFGLVSGRIGSIAVDPANSAHWLVGAATGGIWETHTGGASWTARTDGMMSLPIGALAFAPSDPQRVYAGSGEAHFSRDSYAGEGLLVSMNGGAEWHLDDASTSLFQGAAFSDVKVDPAPGDRLVVATTRAEPLTVRTPPPTGIFAFDRGTWTRLVTGNATDIEVDPRSFGRQYAGLAPSTAEGSSAAGVYRRLGEETAWTAIDNAPWNGMAVGRVELAVAPSNPDVLYVSIAETTSNPRERPLLGLFRTDNAWDAAPAWSVIVTDATNPSRGRGYCGLQCDYDHELIVDPFDADVLYAGGFSLWRLDAGGWHDIGQHAGDVANTIHPDQQALAWAGNRLVVGNDGGVWSTNDGGTTWSNHNRGLAITQFYAGSVDPTGGDLALGGSQDNGTERWSGTAEWDRIFHSDGAPSAIAAVNPTTDWLLSAQELAIARTRDGAATFCKGNSGIDVAGAAFIAPVAECPGDPGVFVAGSDNPWKTTDFFTDDPSCSAEGPRWTSNGPEMHAQITAIAFAPSDRLCRTYAFGTRDGRILATNDGGNRWRYLALTGPEGPSDPDVVPDRWVTDLAFDPVLAGTLYATFSGFDESIPERPGHLFKSENVFDPAVAWRDVGPPSDIPHNTVVVDPRHPDTVWVGTDLAVWKSTDAGASWTIEEGFPTVPVFDLVVQDAGRRLFAFTHGRSAFAQSICTADAECSDGNACSADRCDGKLGCRHTDTSCDDGDACTEDSCNPTTGCRHAATGCDDADACTTDACDRGTGCVHRPPDFASVAGTIIRPEELAPCAGQPLPPSIATLLDRARRLTVEAAATGLRPTARALLTLAGRRLRKTLGRVRLACRPRRAASGRVSAACCTALREAVRSARGRVTCLRSSLQR